MLGLMGSGAEVGIVNRKVARRANIPPGSPELEASLTLGHCIIHFLCTLVILICTLKCFYCPQKDVSLVPWDSLSSADQTFLRDKFPDAGEGAVCDFCVYTAQPSAFFSRHSSGSSSSSPQSVDSGLLAPALDSVVVSVHLRVGCSAKGMCSCATPKRNPPPPFIKVLPQAPCVFELIKWKSNETVVDGLKWRDSVSFKNHPLQQWSKVINCCLQTLVNFLCDLGVGWVSLRCRASEIRSTWHSAWVPSRR